MGIKEKLNKVFGRVVLNVNIDGYARKNTFDEELGTLAGYYGEVRPVFPTEFIDLISWLAIYHEDISQTVKKIVALGNPGHSLNIEAKSDAAVKAALSELNDLARNVFPNNAGADGFINQQLRQIAVKGAICQETVPDQGLNGVTEIYPVQVKTIRFRFEDGRYVPYQKYKLENIKLNEQTFSYIPLFTEDGSPYAIPPMVSALRAVIRSDKQWDGIDEHIKLWSILGLTWMQLDLKPMFNEAMPDFERRAKKEIEKYYDLFVKGRKKGFAITGKNVDLKHFGVSKNANELDKILENTHQALTSGINIDPAFLGRAYSTTETYATVLYEMFINEIANMQRLIKRCNEYSYNFHLLLKKIPASCSMSFNAAPSLKKKEIAEVKEIEQRMVYERLAKGTISEDDAARELGYEKAYAPAQNAGSARGADSEDKAGLAKVVVAKYTNGKYVFERPVIFAGLEKKKSLSE